jgi:hypothetical protein
MRRREVQTEEEHSPLLPGPVEQAQCELCGWISAPTSPRLARQWAATHRDICATAHAVDAAVLAEV